MKHSLYRIKNFINELFYYPSILSSSVSYEQYWTQKKKGKLGVPNSFQEMRAKWISDRIKENSSIVDIGCGDGSVLFAIKKIKNINATGLDVSEFILNFLKESGFAAQSFDLKNKNDLQKIPISEHSLILEVLEHMESPEDFLKEVMGRTRKSVFVSVPNTGFIKHRLRLLLGRFPVQWRSHPSEHLRFWTLRDFHWWLSQLQIADNSTVYAYAGVPILNYLWPSLFAEGIIAEIKTDTLN